MAYKEILVTGATVDLSIDDADGKPRKAYVWLDPGGLPVRVIIGDVALLPATLSGLAKLVEGLRIAGKP